jgi:hypothetical protein
MAKNQSKRVRNEDLNKDGNSLVALKEIKDYKPANPNYTVDRVDGLHENMRTKKALEVKATQAQKSAHDDAVAAEWEFHNAIIAVKDQVIAQFGDDSNEIQSLGLKKTSQRKRPQRKPKA